MLCYGSTGGNVIYFAHYPPGLHQHFTRSQRFNYFREKKKRLHTNEWINFKCGMISVDNIEWMDLD